MWIFASSQSTSSPSIQIFLVGVIGIVRSLVASTSDCTTRFPTRNKINGTATDHPVIGRSWTISLCAVDLATGGRGAARGAGDALADLNAVEDLVDGVDEARARVGLLVERGRHDRAGAQHHQQPGGVGRAWVAPVRQQVLHRTGDPDAMLGDDASDR